MANFLDIKFNKFRKVLENSRYLGSNLFIDFFTGKTFRKHDSKLYEKMPAGLTFFKDFANEQTSPDADFSLGSPTAIFDVTRGVTTPATFIDSSGVVQLLTTSNIPRWTGGHYDENGFNLSPSLLLEPASTNLLSHSYDFSNINWTNSNMGVVVDQDDGPSNITDAQADELTASLANATIQQSETIASSTFTFSIWLKRKTGTGNIDLTIDGGSTWTTKTISTSWARYKITQEAVTNPSSGIRIVTNTDAIYAWGAQLETGYYPTSFIPTTTASLTRNTEFLTYPAPNNFINGIDGSMVMVYRPIMLTDEQPTDYQTIFSLNIDASNEWRQAYSSNANDRIDFIATSGGVQKFVSSSADPFGSSRYSLHSVITAFSEVADGSGNKLDLYIDGTNKTSNVDYTAPVGSLPATFNPNLNNTGMQLVAIALFDQRLIDAEVLQIHNLLGI